MTLTRFSRALFVVTVVSSLLPVALAQKPKAKDTGPKYDAASEVKIKGVVEEIREVPGQWEGTHLVVKTSSATVIVHVGPTAFLKEMEMTFNKGDQVEVVGAKAPDTTEEEILAREIVAGNNSMTLRDAKGIPIWADWKAGK